MIVTKMNNNEILIRINDYEKKEIEDIRDIIEVDMVNVFEEALESTLGYYSSGCQRVIDKVQSKLDS